MFAQGQKFEQYQKKYKELVRKHNLNRISLSMKYNFNKNNNQPNLIDLLNILNLNNDNSGGGLKFSLEFELTLLNR